MNVNTLEDIYLVTFLGFLVCSFTSLVNVIYFQLRFQRKVDRIILGSNYIDGGWIFNSTRLMMYAHYCLFPSRAARAGVSNQVRMIPHTIRLHLILHWGLVITGIFLLTVTTIGISFL